MKDKASRKEQNKEVVEKGAEKLKGPADNGKRNKQDAEDEEKEEKDKVNPNWQKPEIGVRRTLLMGLEWDAPWEVRVKKTRV